MIIPRQYALLNSNGFLAYSCNSLFDTSTIQSTKILDFFPLIESIFSHLINMPIGKKEVFEGVETNKSYLTGIYDFQFFVSTEKDGKQLLNWIIEDHTTYYLKMKYLQQRRQESILVKERLKKNDLPESELSIVPVKLYAEIISRCKRQNILLN